MDIVNSQRKDVYEKKDELEAEIGKIKEKLEEIYKEKDEERERYFQAKLDYENEYDQVKYAEWIQREK